MKRARSPQSTASNPADPAPATLTSASTTDPGRPSTSTTGLGDLDVTGLPTAAAAEYAVSYQDVRVTLTGERALDLDEPKVNAESARRDAYFRGNLSGGTRLTFDQESVALAKSAATTPAECAQAIQLSPTERDVALSQDLVVCAVTNGVGAADAPSRPKMARIVVTAVPNDSTALLSITTWEIPR